MQRGETAPGESPELTRHLVAVFDDHLPCLRPTVGFMASLLDGNDGRLKEPVDRLLGMMGYSAFWL